MPAPTALPVLNGPARPASPAATHGRSASQAQGRGFGDVLDRSRAAKPLNSGEPLDAALLEPATGRKPPVTGDKKEEPVTDLLNLAFFGPPTTSINPAPVAARNTAPDAETPDRPAARVGAQKTTGLAPQDAPLKAAVTDLAESSPHASRTEAIVLPAASHAAPPPAPPSRDAAPGMAQVQTAQATPAASQSASAILERAGSLQAGTPLVPVKRAEDSSAADADTQMPPATQPQLMPPATDRPNTLAASPPVLWVTPVVGSDEWGAAIGQQVLHMNAKGHHMAELNLNPSGLGPLKVTLTIGDSQAQAMFVSAHESVRKAVEAALPQLRTTLAEQGISLGQTSVGTEARQPGGQDGAFAQQNHSKAPYRPGHQEPGRFDAAATGQPLSGTQVGVLHRAGSGLDTFA